jgi:phosphate starvation-inducible protein PhoH
MAVKKRNLTKEDVEDVSIYEERSSEKQKKERQMTLNKVQIRVKCFNEKQKELKRLIEEKDIIIVNGPSGVGKTYFSLLMGLHLLKTEPRYKQLTLIKSVKAIDGEDLGYLPGDVNEKLGPIMESFSGNLEKIFGNSTTLPSLLEEEIIKFKPITYMRGVNIDNQICIIDETQNITPGHFKTIITRLGSNSKFIFLGDEEQIDLKDAKKSCLNRICKIFAEREEIGIQTNFVKEDCIRHPLIPIILDILRANGI